MSTITQAKKHMTVSDLKGLLITKSEEEVQALLGDLKKIPVNLQVVYTTTAALNHMQLFSFQFVIISGSAECIKLWEIFKILKLHPLSRSQKLIQLKKKIDPTYPEADFVISNETDLMSLVFSGNLLIRKPLEELPPAALFPSNVFTKRQVQIMHKVLLGKSNQDIAEQLGKSKRTIEGHCRTVLKKLKAGNSARITHMVLDKLLF